MVSTNDADTLKQLADPAFNPAQTVLVSDKIPPPQSIPATNSDPGTVEFVSYSPKHIQLRANVKAPAILLQNDHLAPNWQVWVDGRQQPILRCNYLMRGVSLPPGEHLVEFRFEPHLQGLYVSVSALVIALVLVGYLVVSKPQSESLPLPPAEILPPKD